MLISIHPPAKAPVHQLLRGHILKKYRKIRISRNVNKDIHITCQNVKMIHMHTIITEIVIWPEKMRKYVSLRIGGRKCKMEWFALKSDKMCIQIAKCKTTLCSKKINKSSFRISQLSANMFFRFYNSVIFSVMSSNKHGWMKTIWSWIGA